MTGPIDRANAPPLDVEAIAAATRAHPGLGAKRPIAVVAEVLGRSDWEAGPGDDGAVVDLPAAGATVVVGGEAMLPGFVEADPFAAGVAAMLTNVNDLAAMGAEPLALVDTIVATEPVARRALEGLRHASDLYRVPIVGGHLTIHDGPPALSAFGLGRATPGRVLSVRSADGSQSFVEGQDYGLAAEGGGLVLPPESRIAFLARVSGLLWVARRGSAG